MKTQEEIEQLANDLYLQKAEAIANIDIRGYIVSATKGGFIDGYIQCQKDNDWTKGCECENSIGQTWCCNQCGLPYDTMKSDKIYTEEDLHTILRLRKEWYSHTDKNVIRDFIKIKQDK